MSDIVTSIPGVNDSELAASALRGRAAALVSCRHVRWHHAHR